MKHRSILHIAANWFIFGLLAVGMGGMAFNAAPVEAASVGGLPDYAPPALQEPGASIPGTPVKPVASATVDFGELARQEALLSQDGSPSVGFVAPFMPGPERVIPDISSSPGSPASIPAAPDVVSPAPALDFMGLDDIPAVGTTTSYIPPDTGGAVGPDRVFVTLNNNYRVQVKSTGAVVSTVSMQTFWSSTGATGSFDPKTTYDPYNQRFIVAAVSNAASTTSSVLVGISDTSDPNGTWRLFRYQICSDVKCLGSANWWADYPTLGFNKNWIAISVNMFGNANNIFQESRMLVIDYPALLSSGTLNTNIFTGLTDFTVHPVVTYDPGLDTLYAVDFYGLDGSGYGVYRTYSLTLTPAGPSLTPGVFRVYTSLSPLSFFNGDLLPQAPEQGTDLIQNINAGDTRVMNAIYRNGYIWFAHAVALPAGGLGPNTHTAARWVKADTSGVFVEGGQVEDPAATAANGGKWYAFPSLAVNRYGDVLLGFSQFSSNQWASAGYTFHDRSDPAGSMRDPYIYKVGEDFYYKTYGSSRNRWGDFSNSQVDPVDDTDLWTIQEYAKPQVNTGDGSGRWSTWWANLALTGLYNSIGTGGNWSSAATWDINAVPQSTDIVTITAGTTVVVDTDAQCQQLTIEQGGVLVVPAGVSLDVSQSVTNHGTLTISQNVDNTSLPFQITDGSSTVMYRLADITTANNLGAVTVSVKALNPGEYCTASGVGSPAYAGRCFQIDAANSQAAAVRLWALTSELGSVSAPAVFRFAGSWTELTGNASTGTNGSYTYAMADTPGFSSFLIGQSGNLPTAVRIQDLDVRSGQALSLLGLGVVALAGLLGFAALRRPR